MGSKKLKFSFRARAKAIRNFRGDPNCATERATFVEFTRHIFVKMFPFLDIPLDLQLLCALVLYINFIQNCIKDQTDLFLSKLTLTSTLDTYISIAISTWIVYSCTIATKVKYDKELLFYFNVVLIVKVYSKSSKFFMHVYSLLSTIDIFSNTISVTLNKFLQAVFSINLLLGHLVIM